MTPIKQAIETIQKLTEENKRYREALEFIANERRTRGKLTLQMVAKDALK